MKRPALLVSAFCLIVGFLLGMIFPRSWKGTGASAPPSGTGGGISAPAGGSGAEGETGASSASQPSSLDARDNLSLLEAACAVTRALKERDYTALAALVHPERGVTFTPYSSVDFETDLTFTPAQLRGIARDSTVYAWGFVDGRGSLIEMTLPQYLERYVYNADYSTAPKIGLDQVLMGGNALENVAEAYPGCRFVDFCFPDGLDSANEGMDWCSLKLVFQPGESRWLLVGIVHGEWTI